MNATTEPTPANLAALITATLGGFYHVLDWRVASTTDANTVTVAVTAYDAGEVQQLPPVRFRVTVEQAS